ncbi:TPA: hypothetical protein HA265_00010 [Candidatus Woesearchaeota archaeon]|nr:hypothetical protein [Candidatus Woesearchaeota archaeon]
MSLKNTLVGILVAAGLAGCSGGSDGDSGGARIPPKIEPVAPLYAVVGRETDIGCAVGCANGKRNYCGSHYQSDTVHLTVRVNGYEATKDFDHKGTSNVTARFIDPGIYTAHCIVQFGAESYVRSFVIPVIDLPEDWLGARQAEK